MRTASVVWSAAAIVGACGAIIACSSSPTPGAGSAGKWAGASTGNWPADDKSMCDWRNHPDLEISETEGPGAIRPNVRRVYKTVGEGESRHKALICREIDTNLDGVKDVVRFFNAKGEATKENADTNYDGKLDVWSTFSTGRLVEEDVDTNFDGAVDVWKTYKDGKLNRIKRDRNFDGKPDIWEIYTDGKLERMGVDTTFDGHVDRWDRDQSVGQEDQSPVSADAGAAAAAAGDAGGK